jgi:hypothetical protein
MFESMKKKSRLLVLLPFLFLLFLLPAPSASDAAQYGLFAEEAVGDAIQAPESKNEGMFKAATRMRKVDLLPLAGKPDGLVKGDTLLLSLFPDADYTAAIDRVAEDVNGTVTVRGRLAGYPLGYILIATHDGRSTVSVRIPEIGKRYAVVFDAVDHSHYLLEIDPARVDKIEDAPVLIPPPMMEEEIQTREEPVMLDQGVNDPATIDVMIVYTPAARTWADAYGGGIALVMAQAMEKAQLVLDNSNTMVTMRLVYAQEVSYTESVSSVTDLERLTYTSDGYIDEVHGWRDAYGADLVAMFTKVENTGGIGWLLNSTSGLPNYAFSITRVQQAGWTYTHIHEMGHNMGLHHHKQQTVQPGPGLYSYSAGWRWTGTDSGRYCSVMTYESGTYFADGLNHTRVAYYSNPDITHQGVPAGHAADGDNARNIREIKHVIAAYRAEVPVFLPGDVNNDGVLDLDDAVLALQIAAGISTGEIFPETDVNGDEKIGIAEAVYVLEKITGIRP